MKTVYKVIEDCEVKKVGERKYEFTASTSTIDRDGEVISVDGWELKNFKKNPVIMYGHDYRSLPVGKATRVWIKDGALKNTVQFPPEGTYEFADIVERLVETGFLKTESVGFIPKEWDEGDGDKSPRRTYTKQELLEISIVPVPSNPDALMNAVDKGVITTKQFEIITEDKTEEEEIKEPEEIEIEGELIPEVVEDEPAKTSQEQICDEIDYLVKLIKDNGMNEEVETALLNLTLAEEEKSGAVLSKANKGRLNQARSLIQEVIDSAGEEEEEEKRLPENDISEDIDQEILDEISKIKLEVK